MAIGKASDFKIYDELVYGGMVETINQNLNAFNGASANAIRMIAARLKGDYAKESFYKDISGLISRRDTTSTASVTDLAMTQGEAVSVKLNRKIGPVGQTLDAFRKVAPTVSAQEEMSFKLGQMLGAKKVEDMLNTAILSVETAIQGQAALNFTITGGTKTLSFAALVSGLAKMGDAQGRVVAWVMHSKPFFDLMQAQIADKVYGGYNLTIYNASVATLGRPVIVTDSPALTDANGSATDTYNVLGLVQDAVVVTESEEQTLASDLVTGLANLVFRVQGEYAYNVACKGFAWDTANGGANPTDATLGTTTNWDKVATSDKDLAGVRIVAE